MTFQLFDRRSATTSRCAAMQGALEVEHPRVEIAIGIGQRPTLVTETAYLRVRVRENLCQVQFVALAVPLEQFP